MDYPKFTRAKLYITNQGKLSSNYIKEVIDIDNYMSLDTAKQIIDYIYNNAEEENVASVLSICGDPMLAHFEDIIKPSIEYLTELNLKHGLTSVIKLKIGTLDLSDAIIEFIKKYNILVTLDLTTVTETDIDAIKTVLNKLPNCACNLIINKTNISKLYNMIVCLDAAGATDINITPNVYDSWTKTAINNIDKQLGKLAEYIINKFEDYDVPAVPLNIKYMCKHLVRQNYINKQNLHRSIPTCNLTLSHGCGLDKTIVCDYAGNIYTYDQAKFAADQENLFYIGKLSSLDMTKIDFIAAAVKDKELASSEYDCSACPLNNICTSKTIPDNFILNGDFLKASNIFCAWQQSLYNRTLEIVKHFDETQDNVLFKDFFYGAVTRRVYE